MIWKAETISFSIMILIYHKYTVNIVYHMFEIHYKYSNNEYRKQNQIMFSLLIYYLPWIMLPSSLTRMDNAPFPPHSPSVSTHMFTSTPTPNPTPLHMIIPIPTPIHSFLSLIYDFPLVSW